MAGHDSSRFDAGAADYDARAGLPDAACADVARALLGLTGSRPGERLVELGAGTGQLGVRLAELGLSYVGLDASRAMLREFEKRAAASSASLELVCADVNEPWPLPGASAHVVFSSRALHLFDGPHVIGEIRRVARGPEAKLVLGRVERDAESLRSVIRRAMRERLREHGLFPKDGRRRQAELLEALCALGARRLGPELGATWSVEQSVRSLLDAWRRKPGLGGVELAPELKERILSELEGFARARFGSLDHSERATERYLLEGVLLAEAALALG